MTHDLAAALLRDVTHDYNENGDRVLPEDAVLSALTAALDPALTERAGEVLEGVTPGPWETVFDRQTWGWLEVNGPSFKIGAPTRATDLSLADEVQRKKDARFIAWCREGVPALLAQIAALRAERDELSSKLEVERALTDVVHRLAKAAEAKVEKLRDAADWQEKQRRDAFARRHINAPEDPHVAALCERYGYGAVMDAASRLWARKDSVGAFYIGGCIGIKPDAALTTEADNG